MLYIIYGIILLVYWFCPTRMQLVIFLINLIVPDPIPYVDEVIMIAGLLKGEN